MRKARFWLSSATCLVAFLLCSPLTVTSQNREKFVISAKAGGINAVTGKVSLHGRGTSEWEQLTIKEDLTAGDVVKTGIDGRVEMLLNPGSYLRVGENAEFELTNNSLENLEVRLIRGTAIVEATGADDTELLINITTPDTRMAIIRRGLYRVNVVPGDGTELIVRKGRVMLDSHTQIKGGNKVVFNSGAFSVAKLQKEEKKNFDTFDAWSKERAQLMAKANAKIRDRELRTLMAGFGQFDTWNRGFYGRSGLWVFHPRAGCFTFLPFWSGWGSPYGSSYSSSFYGSYGYYGWPSRRTWDGGSFPPPAASSGGSGSGSNGGAIRTPPPAPAPMPPPRDVGEGRIPRKSMP